MSTLIMKPKVFPTRPILGVDVAVSSYEAVAQQTLRWAEGRESRSLFFANVHVIMEGYDDPQFRELLNRADAVNPDGVPLVWALQALGSKDATRVYGPDATAHMLTVAESAGVKVGFYGGSQTALDNLIRTVRAKHPRLDVVFMESPPFRALSAEEDEATVQRMIASDARIMFVGLGCPKQEIWVMEHVGRVPAVLFAVGAAFDFLSGSKPQAPRWMMKSGLEWIYRFASEPKRLARRYVKHNPRFVLFFLQQLSRGGAGREG